MMTLKVYTVIKKKKKEICSYTNIRFGLSFTF